VLDGKHDLAERFAIEHPTYRGAPIVKRKGSANVGSNFSLRVQVEQ